MQDFPCPQLGTPLGTPNFSAVCALPGNAEL